MKKEPIVKNYILYHNAEKMGYDLEGNQIDDDNAFPYSDPFDDSDELKWQLPKEFAEEDFDNMFKIVTRNGKEAKECIQNRVWVIQGLGEPREYYLHGYFYPIAYRNRPLIINNKKFDYQIIGNDENISESIKDAIRLNGEFWFIGFKRYFQNFRVGFREIVDFGFVAELDECYEKFF